MLKLTFARLSLFTLVASLLALFIAQECAMADEREFVDIFDGETLDGWEGEEEMFRVEDGAIVAGNLEARIPHNFFLCSTEEYGDYELRYEAKVSPGGPNGGVQIRSRRRPGRHHVIGYQVDIGGKEDDLLWGNLYDESRRNRVLMQGDHDQIAEVLKGEEWNEFIVLCEGPRIQIWFNGYQTVDYTEEDGDIPLSGIIGLQVHGGPPAEISYRNIRIATIASDAPADE